MSKKRIDRNEIGKNIEKRAKELGIKQKELAKEIGLTVPYLNKVYNGHNILSLEKLILTANYLSCTLDYLLGYNIDVYVDVKISKEVEDIFINLTSDEKVALIGIMKSTKEELLKLRETKE